MDFAFILTSFLLATLFYVYNYFKNLKNYWTSRGVLSYESAKMNNKANISSYQYFKSKKVKYGGMVYLWKKNFFPLDLDILKLIVIKHSDHFMNHGGNVNEQLDPLGLSLPFLKDEKWKNLRNKLTPVFTSGKLKMMFQIMNECSKSLVEVLDKESKMNEPINGKEIMARFTTDIIGSAAFGIDCNSLQNPENEFRFYGKLISKRTWRKKLYETIPAQILHFLRIKPKNAEAENFFINLIRKIISYRETNNVYRKDFMHMMLQLKNRGDVFDDEKVVDNGSTKEYMRFNEVASQCFIFFVAGYETSSTLMSYAFLELAQHQDIQDKLRKEIRDTLKKYGGEMTYEALMSMEYLDQVVNESLRLHPPVWATSRTCNKDFKLSGTDLTIEKGVSVIVPIYQVQHDPDYYPEPYKFIPERFTSENKAKRHQLTFMPFGEGHRICIGARFATLQSKLGIATAVGNFKFTLNKNTKLPIEYVQSRGLVTVKGDVWLDFTKVED